VNSAGATHAIQAAIRDAARSVGLASLDLPNFAGQDSQNIAKVALVGMMFIPSKDGVGQSPNEYSSPGDIADGAEVLYRPARNLDQRLTSDLECCGSTPRSRRKDSPTNSRLPCSARLEFWRGNGVATNVADRPRR
jgi:Peptidase family M20/M25/M40